MVNEIFFKIVLYIKKIGRKKEGKKRNILILRTDSIGDLVIFGQTLKQVRDIFVDDKLVLLVKSFNYLLAERSPYVDEVIAVNETKFSKSRFYRLLYFIKLLSYNFEITINALYARTYWSERLVKYSLAERKIGFRCMDNDGNMERRKADERLYTEIIDSRGYWTSELKRNGDLVQYFGCEAKPNYEIGFYFRINGKEEKFAEEILAHYPDKKYLILAPGARWDGRMWPLDRYATLCDRIVEKYPRFKVLICGSQNEVTYSKKIADMMKYEPITLTGKTSLMELAAIIKRSHLYVGSETGIVHIALAFQKPSICVIGGGQFGKWFPYSEYAFPVYNKKDCYHCFWQCKYDEIKCIKSITVKQVFEKVEHVVN